MKPGASFASSPVAGRPRPYDLVAFDVDGTLVLHEQNKVVWEVFNRHFAGDDGVNIHRFEAYRAGELTYPEWVALDVGEWVQRGATRAEMIRLIRQELRPTPGVAETLARLVARGYRLAIISGTLDLVLEVLFPAHPFEVVQTNKLFFDDAGRVSAWEATPYDMEGKAEALVSIAGTMSIPLERTVFVGDNVNDIHVMDRAGWAIAFEPKTQAVRAAADVAIEGSLLGVAELLDA